MEKAQERPIEFTDERDPNTPLLGNHIIFILDNSTSMRSLRAPVVEFFNAQIRKCRESGQGMRNLVSLITFDSFVNDPTYWAADLSVIEDLTVDQYNPSGNTALYDAIGLTIQRLKNSQEFNDPDMSFLIVIITDGENNCSKNYSGRVAAGLIAEMKTTDRFSFIYMGANQDLGKVQKDLGIAVMNTMSFAPTTKGLFAAKQKNAAGIGSYLKSRNQGARSTDSFYSNPDDDDKNS